MRELRPNTCHTNKYNSPVRRKKFQIESQSKIKNKSMGKGTPAEH